MPFLSGGASKILIAKAGDSNYIGFPFISESFNPGGTFISSNAILGDRVRGIGDKGNPTADGSTDIEFRFENLPVFMYAALGDISFSGKLFGCQCKRTEYETYSAEQLIYTCI